VAIYHLHAQVIGRSSGKSAVAAAAYRLGVSMEDARTGLVHDYTRKGGVSASLSLAPANAPEWASDPARLWAEVESVEKRKDAQLCREMDIAIPRELTREQSIELVRAFVQSQFVDEGMCATVAFHHLGESNPHAHVMLTMRSIGPEGFGQKNRDWNAVERLEQWRESWATQANNALAVANSPARIDHRTLEAQGITDRPATKHIGRNAWALVQKGLASKRAEQLATQFRKVGRWMRQLVELTAPRVEEFSFAERLARLRGQPAFAQGVALGEGFERPPPPEPTSKTKFRF